MQVIHIHPWWSGDRISCQMVETPKPQHISLQSVINNVIFLSKRIMINYLHCIISHICIYIYTHTIIYHQSSHISLSNAEMHAGCSSAHHGQSSILCWTQAQKNPWNQWNPYSCWVALGEFGWFYLIQSNCILLHPRSLVMYTLYIITPNHPF